MRHIADFRFVTGVNIGRAPVLNRPRLSKILSCLSLGVVSLAAAAGCFGQTTTWSSPVSANWNTSLDWTNGIPNSSSAVALLSAVGGYTVTLNSGDTVSYFNQSTGTLAISGTTLYLDASSGTSTIGGGLQLYGGNLYANAGSMGHTLTVTGSGGIVANSGSNYIIGNGSGNPLTLGINSGANVSALSGSTLYLGYYSGDNVTNSGTINASGGTVFFGGASGTGGQWHNAGTLYATSGGIIDFGGTFTSADLGGLIFGAGGVLNLTGSLALTGTLAHPYTGTYTLDGGTITGGTVDGSNGALTFSSGGGTLSGVSFINGVTVPANASFTVTGGTTFGGSVTFGGNETVYLGQNLTVGSGLTWSDSGYLTVAANAPNYTLSNAGTMTLNGGNIHGGGYTGFLINNSGTITNQTGTLYLGYYSADAVTNSGTINAYSTGTNYAYLNVGTNSTSVVTNTGTIEASVTGTGYAQAHVGDGSGTTVTNTGFLTANGTNASLYLGYNGTYYTSAWTNTGPGTITASGGGTVFLGGAFSSTNLGQGYIYGAGGTLDIVGTLTNTATPLPPPNSGTYTLDGGIISGGQVDGSNGALTFSNGGGTLSGVSFINAVTVPANASFTVTGGTTFGGNITFGASDTVTLGQNFTIGSGLTWSDSGYLTVAANAPNYTLSNAGTMTLNGGNIHGGGYTGFLVNNSGTITNQSGTLYLGYYSSDAVTNSGTINALSTGTNYAYVNVGDNSTSAITNTGTIEANVTGTGYAQAHVGDGSGTTVTNTGFLTANGTNASLYLGYDGTYYTSAWTNTGAGAITASGGGTVFLGGAFSSTNLSQGHIYGAGGTLDIVGTLTNTATPLLPPNSGTYTLDGGIISGGQVDGSNGALTFSNGGGTLSGVSFINAVTVPANASFTVTGGTTFGGNITFGASDTVTLGQNLTIGSGLTWSDSGYLTVAANAANYTFANAGTMTLNGGNIHGGGYAGFLVNNSGTITNQTGTLYLGYYSSDAVTNSGTINALSTGTNYAYVNVGDNSTSAVTNTGTIEANVTGTGYAQAHAGDGSGTTVTNTGYLTANGTNASLYLGYDGTYYTSAWTNSGGTITASGGGTVFLGGAFSSTNLGQGYIYGAGGTLDIVGTLTNTATPLLPPNSGTYTLDGGIISGGQVDGSNGALTFGNGGGTLSGVSVINAVTVPAGASFTVAGGTTFGGNVTFGASDTVYLKQNLTIGSGLTWSDPGYLSVQSSANNYTLTNAGTMTLNAGNIYGAGYTGFLFNNSGTVTNLTGTLYLAYYSSDSVTNSGTINALSTGTNYSYVNVGNNSTSVVTNSGTIMANVTGTGTAQVHVGDGSGTTVTNTGYLTANGTNASLYLGYDGTSYTSTWSNALGTITASGGGTVYLGGSFTNTNLTQGTINGTGGTLDIVGTLNNSGTLAAPDGGGIFTLYGGTIVGGIVNGLNNALAFSNDIGTLSGVTMTGNFTVAPGGDFTVTNGTSFSSGTTTFGGGNYVYLDGPTGLTLPSGVNWTDSGALYIFAQANNLTLSNQGALTANGGSIYGGGNTGFVFNNSGTFTNSGSSSIFLGEYTGDSVTNTGTIEENGAGGIYLQYGGAQLTNLTSSTLTGGTWIANGGSIYFYGTNPIDTIAPSTTVVLSGPSSTIKTYSGVGPTFQTIEQTLTTNNGTLEVLANRNYSTTNALVNNGSLQVGGGTFSSTSTLTNGSGSTLSGYGTFSFSGGVAIGSGVAVSPGSPTANSYVGNLSFNSLTLGGGGIGTFDVENASGAAGVGYDTLSVSGTVGITATSGTPFAINLESINPGTGLPGAATFNMSQSYTWTLVSAASITGFSASDFTLNTTAFTNGFGGGSLSLTSNGTDIFLNFTPVPEPSTWALIAGGTALVAIASLRRRAAKARPVR